MKPSVLLPLLVAATPVSGGEPLIPTPDDYLVEGLEKIAAPFATFEGSMYAGLIPSTMYEEMHKHEDEEEGKLSFWLFEPDQPTYEDTLVIWLNGGPGCSSMGGCLFENCPVTIDPFPAGYFGIPGTDPFSANKFSWTNATTMMYIEQPHGTGFSYGPIPQDEAEVSRYLYNFLQNFYTIFEDLRLRDRKLFFFGESYAGMFVPSIAHYIQQENRAQNYPHVNLAGIGLGNAWSDIYIQGPAVIDYALWHGMIDSSSALAFRQEWENCRDGSEQSPPFHTLNTPDECSIMPAVLQAAGAGLVDWGSPNEYDVTTWDKYPMLSDPTGSMAQFYNNATVQNMMHFPHTEWNECIPGAGRRRRLQEKDEDKLPGKTLLVHDNPTSMRPLLEDLLSDPNIRVLVYNGDRDLTTNSRGSELLLDSLKWRGSEGWSDTFSFERGLWLVDSTEVGGYVKKYENLQFVVVANSGHLVPFNRPPAALDLVTRFLGNKSFSDKALPKFTVTPKSGTHDETKTSSPRVHHSQEEHHEDQPQNPGFSLNTILFTIVGFVVGLLVPRRFAGKRHGYEPVSNEGDFSMHYNK